MGYYYVNPLGKPTDISYNFLGKIREDSLTREAQLKDNERNIKSHINRREYKDAIVAFHTNLIIFKNA